mmetsp:Transcript_5273/g.15539  ORF Transcript_5273/g.15539 Transcript_5273/m.15539 type:complete len:84 (+) Transcript_5273:1271-1522(+)
MRFSEDGLDTTLLASPLVSDAEAGAAAPAPDARRTEQLLLFSAMSCASQFAWVTYTPIPEDARSAFAVSSPYPEGGVEIPISA